MSNKAQTKSKPLSPPRGPGSPESRCDALQQHPAPISPFPTQSLRYVAPSPFSQPFMPSLLPLGHWLHFMPVIPVLQEHSPVICSQSSRTEPTGSQLQAG